MFRWVILVRKSGPFASVTRGSRCLKACWCIQLCIWAFVSWSGVVLACCSPAAGSHGAGAKPLQDSSSASSLSRWLSCVFWWTSWACSASAPRGSPCVPWGRKRSRWPPDARRSSTSPGKSTWSPPKTPLSWTEVIPGSLQKCCHGFSSQRGF